MTVYVYAKEEKIIDLELNIGVIEYLVIQAALRRMVDDIDTPEADRVAAAQILSDTENKVVIDLGELS